MLSKTQMCLSMRDAHTGSMDLVAACEAFVSVAESAAASPEGAAAVGMSQPGASRRIAALERHLGVSLLDRSGRSPALTPGRATACSSPPDRCSAPPRRCCWRPRRPDCARSTWPCLPGATYASWRLSSLASRDAGLHLVLIEAEPRARADLLSRGRVEAQVAAVPGEEGDWTVALGLAGALPRRVASTSTSSDRPAGTASARPRTCTCCPRTTCRTCVTRSSQRRSPPGSAPRSR